MGKSRLVWELTRSHRTQGCLVLESGSVSYGKATPYLPVIDPLKGYCRIQERDDLRAIRERVAGKLLTLDRALEPLLTPLLALLDVPVEEAAWDTLDPPQRRQRTLDAVKRLLLRESQVQPLLVVFEDLHWIDAETQALLDGLMESLPTARLMLLVNYRPEYQHAWGGKTYYTQLRIDPLPPESAEALLTALLGQDGTLEPLKRALVERTEGNPFFLEESVQTLVETKVLVGERGAYRMAKAPETWQIPATAQAILAARIDRLPPEDKRLLQAAAVIGKDVPFALLQAIADVPEDTLRRGISHFQAAEFLYETSLFPDLEYTFKHALTHEVTYRSLLQDRRRALHRRLGLAIERLHSDRLAEHVEILAHHFSSAEEWESAFEYLRKAAEKAAAAYATREAIGFYDRALAAGARLEPGPDARTLMAIYQARADLHSLLSDFGRARADRARALDLAREAGDLVTQGAALAAMGMASVWAHDFDQAVADAQAAIQVVEGVDATAVLAAAYTVTAAVYEVTGRLDEARADAERAVPLARSVSDAAGEALAMSILGEIRNFQGQYGEAIRLQSEALQTVRAHRFFEPWMWILFSYGVASTGQGAYDQALTMLEEGLALSAKVGDEHWRHRLLNTLGWLYGEVGDVRRSLELNRQGAEEARPRGDPETIANAELNLGDLLVAEGDLLQAHELLAGVHRLVKNPGTSDWMKWRYSTHLFASLGEFWLARGEPSQAREFANQCLELATRTTSRKYLVRGWRLAGEIALAQRRWEEAEQALRHALTFAETIGNPTQLWKTHVALGGLFAETKQPEAAQRAYRAARTVIEQVRGSLTAPRLRAGLESAQFVRRVCQLADPD